MYFQSRYQAGERLAQKLGSYKDRSVIVMALNAGGIELGEVIAKSLGAKLTMLISRDISVPGEEEIVGSVDQAGGFSYNSGLSAGQIDEYTSEFHNYLESQKFNKASEINQLISQRGTIDRHFLRDKIVILVADGFSNTSLIDSAMSYLKPTRLTRLIIAAPIASVAAVDRMHVAADEVHVLSVLGDYLDTNHYYNNMETTPVELLMSKLDNINENTQLADKPTREYN